MFGIPEVETVEPLTPLIFTARDAIQILFQLCGEVIVHQVRKTLLQQTHYREGNPLGNQRGAAPNDVAAVDDHGNDGGVGGGPANTALLQSLHQTRFGVSRGRLCAVRFCRDLGNAGGFSHRQGGKDGIAGFVFTRFVFRRFFVFAFLIRLEESTFTQHSSRG